MNPPLAAPSLAAQIANLPKLSMKDLWSLWDKYFPRRPPHNNRAYVEGRARADSRDSWYGAFQRGDERLDVVGHLE
jgi:hypothetical protein